MRPYASNPARAVETHCFDNLLQIPNPLGRITLVLKQRAWTVHVLHRGVIDNFEKLNYNQQL